MKIGVISGIRYHRVGDQYYTDSQFNAGLWQECLEVFDEVLLAHRVVYREKVAPDEKSVLIDGIRFFEFPNSTGYWGALGAIPKMLWKARKAVRQADVWHLHTPNIVSTCMSFWVWFYKIPYSLELRGDQSINSDYLELRGVRFAKLVAFLMRTFMWLQMSSPVAVVSVARFLVELTKPRNSCPVHIVSNARIPTNLYRQPRKWKNDSSRRIIVCSGRIEAQKNPIGAIRALAKLEEKGFKNWKLVWLGDGPLREETQQLADKLGLLDKIELLGFVPWQGVFGILDTADLFLLNSVAEGLPRAVLEAMACALPVVATRTGGWAEILSESDVVEPMRDDLLADKIYEVLTNPARLTRMSRRNLATAKNYSAEVLRAKKIAFYNRVRTIVAHSK